MNANDITFGLMTGQDRRDRAASVLLTWGKNLPNLYFVTDENTKDTRFLNLSKGREGIFTPTDYRSNTEKQIELIKFLDKKCKPTPWYFLADDDTYVYTDHVLELLENKQSQLPIYVGKMINYCPWDSTLIYASGGAGFILNRLALELLSKQWHIEEFTEPHIKTNIYADVAQGFGLREQGVNPILCKWHLSENHFSRSSNINDHVNVQEKGIEEWFYNKYISYHRITSDQMITTPWEKFSVPDNFTERMTPYRISKLKNTQITKDQLLKIQNEI